MAKVRSSAGVNKGSKGAANVSPMYQNAAAHQKDLANISGEVQGLGKGKGKIGRPGSPSYETAVKAIARTQKSFK